MTKSLTDYSHATMAHVSKHDAHVSPPARGTKPFIHCQCDALLNQYVSQCVNNTRLLFVLKWKFNFKASYETWWVNESEETPRKIIGDLGDLMLLILEYVNNKFKEQKIVCRDYVFLINNWDVW